MTRQVRNLTVVAGLALAMLVFGFVVFANSVTREPVYQDVSADAIVVLTGGPERISEAARLLMVGKGQRLLISGVNRQTRRDSLRKISGLDQAKFDCCVDLDYAALDTIGNASESSKWARKHGYKTLVVVTSSQHMPRSLMELARAMPGVELVPHPVGSPLPPDRPWWLEVRLARSLGWEYLKFLAASGKLVASRGLAWLKDRVGA